MVGIILPSRPQRLLDPSTMLQTSVNEDSLRMDAALLFEEEEEEETKQLEEETTQRTASCTSCETTTTTKRFVTFDMDATILHENDYTPDEIHSKMWYSAQEFRLWKTQTKQQALLGASNKSAAAAADDDDDDEQQLQSSIQEYEQCLRQVYIVCRNAVLNQEDDGGDEAEPLSSPLTRSEQSMLARHLRSSSSSRLLLGLEKATIFQDRYSSRRQLQSGIFNLQELGKAKQETQICHFSQKTSRPARLFAYAMALALQEAEDDDIDDELYQQQQQRRNTCCRRRRSVGLCLRGGVGGNKRRSLLQKKLSRTAASWWMSNMKLHTTTTDDVVEDEHNCLHDSLTFHHHHCHDKSAFSLEEEEPPNVIARGTELSRRMLFGYMDSLNFRHQQQQHKDG